MLLNVIVRDITGKVVEMAGHFTAGLDTIVVPVVNVESGFDIEVIARDDDSNLLGTFYAANAFAAKTVTATNSGGVVAVTDDASNTYTLE